MLCSKNSYLSLLNKHAENFKICFETGLKQVLLYVSTEIPFSTLMAL